MRIPKTILAAMTVGAMSVCGLMAGDRRTAASGNASVTSKVESHPSVVCGTQPSTESEPDKKLRNCVACGRG